MEEKQKQVDISISTYKAMFWDYSGIRWEDACNYARTFIPTINSMIPTIWRRSVESHGPVMESTRSLALNVRSEISVLPD